MNQGVWKPAKKKLTKSQKNQGRRLREEIEWLEGKLNTKPELIADSVELKHEGDKLIVVRTQEGRMNELWQELNNMKKELKAIYE